ncbi:nuclease-related domain-containing DEAD/DEAH box helicase [Suttonella indologenes]|uniref:Superfamily I DNA and RNA helicases n=1 Tax=Suttonella indologenes TaxID=13276 RepID=A0A380N0F6_9GAMM|nr:NERD domain-containing protein [Suttonella indologenes]SUO97756.1 Superfamily I DNA and RNA helicases [Suttonella indologenes]
MAIIYPKIESIKKWVIQPTEGEWFLLNYLKDNLDNSFEIFFNPFLDGDRPDFVVLKKNVGVFIIEVKDWNINSQKYRIDLFNKWYFNSNSGYKVIKSPFSQAFNYKKNFYDIHIPLLGIKNVINPYFFNVIDIFVYLHCTDKDVFERFYEQNNQIFNQYVSDFSKGVYVNFPMDKIEYYRKKQQRDKNLAIFQENTDRMVRRIMNRNQHPLFTDDIYDEFKRRLSPSQFILEQGKIIYLDKKQEKLAQSSVGLQKIKGVAGCGKTEVLLNRAINAIKRTNTNNVLILTYNNTLKPYLKYRLYGILRRVNKEKFDEIERDIFEITNYHRFYIAQANNLNIDIQIMNTDGLINENQSRKNIFLNNKEKYDVILIDEIQDYEADWIKIIRDSFLAENGEMVIFGDQTQNIYKRDIKNRESSLVHGFGKWQALNKSYRSYLKLIDVFSKFKESFLIEYKEEESYEYKEPAQGSFDIGHEAIIHQNINSLNDACECIRAIIRDNKLIQNDTCVLSSKILTLQQIENKFSDYEKTTTAFETFSDIKDIEISIDKIPNEQLKKNSRKFKIEKLRKIKKDHFHINSGLVKFSTIHSFKGLEIKNVFIIVHQDDSPEIIYTGITRSIENLFIISIGNTQYNDFFKSVVTG